MSIHFKRKLTEGNTLLLGTWLTMDHVAIAEIACNSGYEWICVDLEHSAIDISGAEKLIRVIDLKGKTPLVRLSSNCPIQAKRVMDAGAHGVIVPMVNSALDAKKAVESIYYPPKGVRGVGLARAQAYGAGFKDYWKNLKELAVVIVQIEHIDAVNCIEEIFSTEGVDAYIIGPYDLSASMGIPGEFEHAELISALNKIRKAGEKFKKPGGIHIVEPDLIQLKSRVEEGFKFIAYSVDMRILDVNFRKPFEK